MATTVKRRPGFSLIELLVVCVVLVILSAGAFTFYAGHSKPGDKARTPMERGHDPVCINNLQQVRAAIATLQVDEESGKYPATLQDVEKVKGITPDFLECPEGHEPYQYDPATGQVHCVHAGHEKF